MENVRFARVFRTVDVQKAAIFTGLQTAVQFLFTGKPKGQPSGFGSSIAVSRGYDLLAQALIYFTFSPVDAALAGDLLAYDPTVDDQLEERRARTVLVAATEKLTTPFGLVAWKNIALDRLSQTEHLLLKVEMERLAGAMAYHQLVS